MIYQKKIKTIVLKVQEPKGEKMHSSENAFEMAKAIYAGLDDDQEHFSLLFLDGRNRLTGYKVISSGGQTSSLIDPKIAFRNALVFGATSIILIHNHPSGELRPSKDDITITKRLEKLGELLDIKVLDHLIINKESYYSFQSEELIKEKQEE